MRLSRTVLAALCAGAVLASPAGAASPRIVGGHDAPAGTYRSVAKVVIASTFGCTGTLIAPQWVLTAAHCGSITGEFLPTPVPWLGPLVSVTLGTEAADGTGGERASVSSIIVSPAHLLTEGYDVALLKLSKPSAQTPVPVAGRGEEALWRAGASTTIVGFGLTKEDGNPAKRLQEAQVPVIADASCASVYPTFEADSQICAGFPQGGVDSCQGDSGGPMFARTASGALRLVGATSYGRGCARPNTPGVYARVADTKLREWIRGVVGGGVAADAKAVTTKKAAKKKSTKKKSSKKASSRKKPSRR